MERQRAEDDIDAVIGEGHGAGVVFGQLNGRAAGDGVAGQVEDGGRGVAGDDGQRLVGAVGPAGDGEGDVGAPGGEIEQGDGLLAAGDGGWT